MSLTYYHKHLENVTLPLLENAFPLKTNGLSIVFAIALLQVTDKISQKKKQTQKIMVNHHTIH